MKFKAVMENEGVGGSESNQSRILHVLQALQRLEKAADQQRRGSSGPPASVVLKLSAESFAFCHRAGADEGSQTWSHFHINKLFKDYRIESKRQNKIDLEAPIANLVHVFNSCAKSERTTLRLANGEDGRPILGFQFHLAGNVADHRVEQDVPVRVIPEAEADNINEPALPEPEYQIELPQSLQRLKGVLEKMIKVGAQHVSVEASQEKQVASAPGEDGSPALVKSGSACLRLEAEAELVAIASTFPSLTLVMEGKKEQAPDVPVKLSLSLRRLAEVLTAFQQVSAEAHIACVLGGRALVLYALLPQSLGSLISYTPAVTN